MALSYSEAVSDRQFMAEYAAAIEASKKLNFAAPTGSVAVETPEDPLSTKTMLLSVALDADLSNSADLRRGVHNCTTIYCMFGSEVVELSGNEAVRLAQLSRNFSALFIRTTRGGKMLIPKVNLIADKFITGSAFVAMKDIALYRAVSNAPSAYTYSNLFSEDWGMWISAILYADVVFGPFAGVKEWVDTKNITVRPRPMRHEFYMVLPHLERDAVVRCEHFDTSQQYDFHFRPAGEVTQEEIANMVQKNWTYLGSRVVVGPDARHEYGFRKLRC